MGEGELLYVSLLLKVRRWRGVILFMVFLSEEKGGLFRTLPLSVYNCLSSDDMESGSCRLPRFDAAGANFSGTALKYVGDHFP